MPRPSRIPRWCSIRCGRGRRPSLQPRSSICCRRRRRRPRGRGPTASRRAPGRGDRRRPPRRARCDPRRTCARRRRRRRRTRRRRRRRRRARSSRRRRGETRGRSVARDAEGARLAAAQFGGGEHVAAAQDEGDSLRLHGGGEEPTLLVRHANELGAHPELLEHRHVERDEAAGATARERALGLGNEAVDVHDDACARTLPGRISRVVDTSLVRM